MIRASVSKFTLPAPYTLSFLCISLVESINFLLFLSKFHPFWVQVFQANILFTRLNSSIWSSCFHHFLWVLAFCFSGYYLNHIKFYVNIVHLEYALYFQCLFFYSWIHHAPTRTDIQIFLNKHFMDIFLLTKLNIL